MDNNTSKNTALAIVAIATVAISLFASISYYYTQIETTAMKSGLVQRPNPNGGSGQTYWTKEGCH